MEEGRHRHVLIEQFVTTARRGIAEAEAAAREHQSRGDEGYAELAGRAAEMMRRLLRRIESGEVSEADLQSPSGVGRFLGEHEWTELDEPFLVAMDDAIRLWAPAVEAVRPELGPRDDRGVTPP